MKLPSQILITDSKKIDPVAAAKNLPQNSAVILRDYELSYAERLSLGMELKKICTKKKALFLVANDYALALKLNADGMHFSEYLHNEMRRISAKKTTWFFSSAAHSRRAVKSAYENGANIVLISPVFSTPSHPDKKPLGITLASYYIYRGLPAYALGGVKPHHAKALRMADFCGFAGISWVKNCCAQATIRP